MWESATRAATAVALVLLLGSSTDDLHQALQTTAATYLSKIAAIATVAGRDTTYDYYERLRDDADTLEDPTVPAGYTASQWLQTITAAANLDLSLATQLIGRNYRSMATIRGLGESFVRSSSDGTMQPVAVYVPRSYRPANPAPLIVMLHGRPQPETQLLAPPYVASLAEESGAIVVAPWGHGYYDFRGSASEVYDALHAATQAFRIDPRRKFLAGYSMGGFSVFEVAPLHADDWSAVMCIAGSVLMSNAERVVTMMPRTPFYVLTGSADASIPTRYPTVTAAFLRASGIEVSFYSEPGGQHRLITLLPILTQAWNDMLHGVVRSPPPELGSVTLPSEIPMSATRP